MMWLACYFGMWLVALRMKRVPLARFDFVVTATWFIASLLAVLPLVVYPKQLSLSAIGLTAASHASLVGGFYLLGGGRSRRRLELELDGLAPAPRVLVWVTVAFIIATFGVALSEGRLPLLGAFGEVQVARNAFLETGATGLDAVLLMLSYVATVFIVLLPQFAHSGQRAHAWLSLAGFVALTDFNLTLGARAGIVFALVAATVCYLIVYRPRLRDHLVLLLVAGAVVLVFGGSFVHSRNPDFSRSPDTYLAYNCARGEFADWIAASESETLNALASSSCYFSSPSFVFDLMLKEADWEPRLGAYNASRLMPEGFMDARADIAEFLQQRNLAPNPWAGAVRDMWLDLGVWAPIGFGYLGMAVALLVPVRIRSELQLARVSLLSLFGFMIPFLSPLILAQVVYPIGVTVLLAAVVRQVTPAVPSCSVGTGVGTATDKR
jgi:hypothetical protein